MREIEEEFRHRSGLLHRSHYKIFYCKVFPAPILTLGINPGGTPDKTSLDGTLQEGGLRASASAGYFENDEHDVLDCDWKENVGLRELIYPLVGRDPARFRAEVVKTNLAFRRSKRKSDIDIEAAFDEAESFLAQIIRRVKPRLVLLTGVPIATFLNRYAITHRQLSPAERDPGVKQIVFAAAKASLRSAANDAVVVQVAHASQFAWTYGRYNVAERALEYVETHSLK